MEHFNQRIEKNKQDAAAFAGRASILQNSFEWDKALADYETAIGLGLKSSKLHCTRGFLRLMRDKPQEALADFNEALRLDPKNVEAVEYRGLLFEELGQYDKAFADHRRAIELAPNDPNQIATFATALAACPDAKFRNGKQAINLAMKACQLSQWQSSEPISALAAGYAETGDFAKAVEFAQRAIDVAIDPVKKGLEEQLALYKEKKPYRWEPEKK
jgi:tetratricopeptide (TPR) repeat protein